MRILPIVLALVLRVGVLVADAQTVVVPETPFSGSVSMTAASTVMLDHDSVLMTYTHNNSVLGAAEFTVVNIDTGATELPAVRLPEGMRVSSAAVLSPVSGLIVVRDDNASGGSKGKYFVVNPLTGAIVRGPVPFTSQGTGWEYRIAVVDSSTVLIAHRSNIGLAGVFTVVDPQTGSVKVPEMPFAPSINTVEVATLDAQRVAIAYGTPGPDFRMSFTVIDPQDGHVVRPPEEIEGGGPFALLPRTLDDVVIGYYDTEAGDSRYRTLNAVTGALSSPTTFATGGMFTPAASLVGANALFIGFSRPGAAEEAPAQYVLHDIDGPQLIPATPFNPEGPSYAMSAVSSGCRTLIAYMDVPDNQIGKFQVLDFSGVCDPPPCPANITDQLELFQSFFVPFFVPELQLQLVLMRSRTDQPMAGPFTLVAEDLQNATMLGSRQTGCSSTGPAPSFRLSAGPDDILSPGEFGGAFVLFLKTGDPIAYRPRVLNGIPQR